MWGWILAAGGGSCKQELLNIPSTGREPLGAAPSWGQEEWGHEQEGSPLGEV